MKKFIVILLLLSTQLSFATGFPDQIGIVNDYEGVLTPKQEKTLTKFISKYQIKTNVKMLVVSTKDFKPATSIKKYVLGLFEHWKYTPNQTKNGVLIVFSYSKKELQIIPGHDIKSILTERKLLSIIQNVMEPKFLKEKYFSGLKKGIKAIYKTIKAYQAG
jgi:uncharacterized protein